MALHAELFRCKFTIFTGVFLQLLWFSSFVNPSLISDLIISDTCGTRKNDLECLDFSGPNGLEVCTLKAQLEASYRCDVNSSKELIVKFDDSAYFDEGTALRVTVSSENAFKNYPALFVVRQDHAILSWQVPLRINRFEYSEVSRTICPPQNSANVTRTSFFSEKSRQLFVEVSSASPTPITFNLSVNRVASFILSHGVTAGFDVTPSQPQYFEYEFAEGENVVLIHVTSPTVTCMTVAVQKIQCPVYDMDRTVEFSNLYQTMSRQAGITVSREDFSEGKFYIIFNLKTNDYDCLRRETIKKRSELKRIKHVEVTVISKITKIEYYEAVLGALIFFAIFFLFSVVVSAVYFIREVRNPSEISLLERSDVNNYVDSHSPLGSQANVSNYGTSSPTRAMRSFTGTENQQPIQDSVGSPSTEGGDSDTSVDETDIDMLPDADSEKDVFRTKTFLYVADLARKRHKKMRRKTRLYSWNLLTIAIFYLVPVVQLVYTYQTVLHITGNQDICYYNFLCSHPFGVFSDFNHVFSNIGYLLLGLLFVGLVWRRQMLYQQSVAKEPRLEKYYGIPQHFGLFYAMGLALIMEGFLSGSYHVCPNYSNFQFDTAFMYFIAALCMLRIYQTRHLDITANSHCAYLIFAIIIIMGVLGVLNGSIPFWIVFGTCHVLACLALSAQIYYMGRWKLDIGIFKRLYVNFRNDMFSNFFRPMYMDRLVLLVLVNAVNLSYALYGVIMRPLDFATYLLSIFIINLLLYVTFYIIMKLRHGERILPLPLAYILLSILTWGSGLYFFMQRNTSWQKSPSQSRENNKMCLLLHFYDDHDVWHFLSSAALFFSFMLLLTLDDDLIYTPRDKIPVF